ncbi:MAG: D-alanyl-D-alanine carboxypeptidase [Clostridiales bacterium]|nr:D-alanyl-D-alanine carboxypeptidase [Clostridiales bacterium]
MKRCKRIASLLLILALALALPSLRVLALEPVPALNGSAVLLLHPETGTVIYARDADRPRAPSSLVKLMTALIAVEALPDLSRELTVSKEALANLSGLATAGLKAGEVLTVEQLLYCLLLPSAGDAALVLAEAVAGDEASFVARMNQRAEALGMAGTHYVNPHGRDHDLQYTTAADLAVLARQVMKNETLRTICATQYKRIAKTNLTTDRYYFSNNALIISSTDRRKLEDYYYAPARGLMTGYSAAAGYNLVATAKKGGLELICVVLGASKDEASGNKRHYTDAVSLFTWCYGNLQYAELLKPLDPVCEVTVQLSNTRDAMTLVAPQGCWALIPADVAPAEMARSFELQQDIEAPIARGEVLGRVTFSHADIPYASCLLAAQSAAERSPLLFVIDRIGNFFSGRWARLVLFTTVVLVVLYLGLTILLNRRRRVQKARRRAGGKGPYR